MELRVGIGYDAHALEEGVPLVLGGVPIEYSRGLAGHSDGDVITHALIDALLGAANLGDIGSLFPSGDEQYRGASSLDLLWEAYREVREVGWELVNADCTCHHDGPPRLYGPRRGSRSPSRCAPPTMKVVRYADRPDLRGRRFEELTQPTFPAYMNENEPGNLYWDRLYTDFPDYQVALVDGDDLLAEAHAISLPWNGSLEDLPSGWDEGFVRGMTSERPHTALMAIAISVAPSQQGRQLSSRMIQTFTDNARAGGLANGVIAPVRPTWKERYPLIPIESYIEWRREDGSHFDPWIRVHEVVGGEILAAAPRSMVIRGSVAEWAEWTGMAFPGNGEYVFPGCLATLVVEDGIGTHVEPNVWMLHRV
jgi:2-C-methyl-D-erythritol 2,4-cyclodiphosphate synthase